MIWLVVALAVPIALAVAIVLLARRQDWEDAHPEIYPPNED